MEGKLFPFSFWTCVYVKRVRASNKFELLDFLDFGNSDLCGLFLNARVLVTTIDENYNNNVLENA